VDAEAGVAAATAVGAVVLAAGRSRRMGEANKLVEPVAGVPMVVRVVDRLLASRARPVVVVTGYDSARVERALGDRRVLIAHNPDFDLGMSTSLRRGIEALVGGAGGHRGGGRQDRFGVLVCLGDMPGVETATVDALIAAFLAAPDDVACVPAYRGRRGNPVLWGARFLPEVMAVRGDVGARGLLAEHPEAVLDVPVDDPGVLLDVDTPDALHGMEGKESG